MKLLHVLGQVVLGLFNGQRGHNDYVPEAHNLYFIWRCRFLNCSEEKGCMGRVGGGGGVQVRNVTLRTSANVPRPCQ